MSDAIIQLPNQRTDMQWTSYLATAYAEGFGEGEEATGEQSIEAWACLIKTGLCWNLQGFFGRNASQLIDNGVVTKDGTIDWDTVDATLGLEN